MHIEIYTEATPNPETLKFVANRMLLPGQTVEFKINPGQEVSPLAAALFSYSYVKSVFIAQNFVTITKNPDTEWIEVTMELKPFLTEYLSKESPILSPGYTPSSENETTEVEGEETEIERNIKRVLETYVKPAVEMDGGAIHFKSFEEGRVTVSLKGSCSGCPSSTVTLKSGIEGLLTRMVPEVKEVVAEAE